MRTISGAGFLQFATKTLTFTGAANLGQAGTAATVFTVTGDIAVVILVPTCTVNLGEAVGGATVALGVTSKTTFFVGATNSVDIDAADVWFSITPDVNAIAIPAGFKDIWLTENIIVTCAVQNTNAGAVRFDMYWMPLSPGASVT